MVDWGVEEKSFKGVLFSSLLRLFLYFLFLSFVGSMCCFLRL